MNKNRKKTSKKKWLLIFLGIVVIAAAGYSVWAVERPLPPLRPIQADIQLRLTSSSASLNWPVTGQSALGILGSNILETNNDQSQLPTASTAKLITALTVLSAKPLQLNDQGPTITLSANDVSIYQAYLNEDGSVVEVQAGEQISEYQMLEAMLLPSANNMADSLAIWAFGSLANYQTAANQYLATHDLKNTTIGSDASGFLPSTTSNAEDLVKIGELTMDSPVLAQIVGQTSASGIPIVNTVKNVNFLIGTDNIVGIKTGNNDQDMGVYVSAATINIGQKPVTIVTSTMNASSLYNAVEGSLPLVVSAEANFKSVALLKAGSIVGDYLSPNGDSLPVVASQDLNINTWSGDKLTAKSHLSDISSNSKSGDIVGTLTVYDPITGDSSSINVKLGANPEKPTLWQRLTHPNR
jgi:serine-type D-Ala-D-Ala carboxypeptidase (penicillin-binding protein 5/6)